jgi:signal transduction histidine kinase
MNVVRHAGADAVKVTIGREDGHVRLTVEDNGRGFDFERAVSNAGDAGGFGLFSIRERLSSVGGRLEVDSGPGHGARVTMTAPLAGNEVGTSE